MSELIHPLPECARPYPTRYRSSCIILRCGPDPIRPDTGVCTLSSGMDPILSDQIPKLIHPLLEWIRSYPVRYQSLYPFFRNGSDPIRSHTEYRSSQAKPYPVVSSRIHPDTEAYTSCSGMDPILSDPTPKLIPLLPEWIRPDPIRYRSLYILSRHGPDPIRSDTGAYTPYSGMDPARPDPIPELIHPLLG
jgi:hypothetical protein